MLVIEKQNPALHAGVHNRNLIRQYDLLIDCIQVGIQLGYNSFDKYLIWALNHVAVVSISQFGGRFREEPIYVGNHIPPPFKEVSNLMDRYISFIHENWFNQTPTALAAYGLWRLNWIHPFIEGNGRTARAVCYYLLCARSGGLLPGNKILPERIREHREPYVQALRAADRAWEQGQLDVSELELYLVDLVQRQISNAD